MKKNGEMCKIIGRKESAPWINLILGILHMTLRNVVKSKGAQPRKRNVKGLTHEGARLPWE